MKKRMPYSIARRFFETGDVALFKGTGLTSMAIRIGTAITKFRWDVYSHSGSLVVLTRALADKLGIDDYDDSRRVYLYHSTRTFTDGDDGKKGVRLVRFSDFVRDYKGKCFVRRLLLERDREFYDTEFKHIIEHLGVEYEKMNIKGIWNLISAAYDGFGGRTTGDTSRMMCSELVIDKLQWHRILPPRPSADEHTPTDIAIMRTLMRGIWGNLVRLDYDTIT
ncbi:hypothetical protein LCGC14_0993390 [marine sediment metagenome]|uniref:Uncharacterized protein n=1 Tax=marine sediment metagenome TaxID=412755 RepID=A0A0F9N548_9ZZZZ